MSPKKTFKAAAASLALALSLSACSLFENDNRFEPTDLTKYDFQADGHEIWKVKIGSGGSTGFAPSLVGQSIFAATPSGSVASVNAASGSINWTTKLKEDLAGGAASDGRIVVVTSRDGEVIALNASDGSELWRSRGSTLSSTPAVLTDKLVIIREDDYRIEAFSKDNGELQWVFQRSTAPMALRGNIRMSVVGDTLLAPVPIGRLVALDVSTGRLKWDLPVALPQGTSDIDNVTDIVGKPVFANDKICMNSYQGNASCYTFESSDRPEQLWSKNFSSSVGLFGAGEVLFGSSVHGELTAFSAQNGDIQWQDSTLYNRGLTNPVLYKDLIYVGDYEGYIHFFDARTGKLLGRMKGADSDPISSDLTVTEYGVLVQSGDGKLQLLEAIRK